ncbi:MAG: hypothetical protein KDE27_02120 [Planctomycetes bacterium]|nr:hypothetical protein [Planctomycetota bacterium]
MTGNEPRDDQRRERLRRKLGKSDGPVEVAAADLRWLLDEVSRLSQSNERLRRQNRKLRLRRGADVDVDGDTDADSDTGTDET